MFFTTLSRPSKPAPRPVVRKNDDYNPSVNRPSAGPSRRPDRERAADKGGRKPASAASNKPSREPRQADRGDRGRGQQKGDKDKGAAKKEHKARKILCNLVNILIIQLIHLGPAIGVCLRDLSIKYL